MHLPISNPLNSLTAQQSRLVVLLLITLLLVMASSFFVQARTALLYDDTSDFSAYFAAYTIKRELGSGIYDRDNFRQLDAYDTVKGNVREYLYTPVTAELLSLFMPKDYTTARIVWLILEHLAALFLVGISTILCLRLLKGGLLPALTISLLVFAGYSAIERSLFYGQASLVLAALTFFSLLLFQLGRGYTAAFFAAFATIFKLYPMVVLIALLLKGQYRYAAAMLGFLIVIPLGFIAIFGVHDWHQFILFQAGNPLVDRDGATSEAIALSYQVPNYSPTALIFLLSDQFDWQWTQLQIWQATRASIILAAAILLSIYFRRVRDTVDFFQLTALGFCGIMLVSPMLWNHVFILLFPVYAVLIYRGVFDARIPAHCFAWLLISLLLVAVPDYFTNLRMLNDGALVLLKFNKLYGLLILVVLLFFTRFATHWTHDAKAS